MAYSFPTATVDLIEKISLASWQRLKRIQEMRAMPAIDDVPETKESLGFQDSGIGSSIETTCDVRKSSKASIATYKSFIETNTKSITLPQMPGTVNSKSQFLCFVCQKTIEGVSSERQWR